MNMVSKSKIIVKPHAIDRATDETRFKVTSRANRAVAREAIIFAVNRSFLLRLNPDGSELRGHNGKIYVCRRSGSSIVVHTVLKGNRYVV